MGGIISLIRLVFSFDKNNFLFLLVAFLEEPTADVHYSHPEPGRISSTHVDLNRFNLKRRVDFSFWQRGGTIDHNLLQ